MKFSILLLLGMSACSISSGLRVVTAIDRDSIERAIHSHASEYRECSETCFKASPEQCTGKIVFGWNVRDDGSVGDAKVKSSTILSQTMVSCVQDVLEKTQFKPTEGPLHITYPFLFSESVIPHSER
jgi:hypothetical protein